MNSSRYYDKRDYENAICAARVEVIRLLKDRKNRPIRRETIVEKLKGTYPVDFDRVLRSEPTDEYQIQPEDPKATKAQMRFIIKRPDILNREQLMAYIKDHPEGITLSQIVLFSCYDDCQRDIEDLELSGQIVIYRRERDDDERIMIVSRERYFDSKEQIDRFKEWFSETYRKAAQETLDRLAHQKHMDIRTTNTRQQNLNKIQPVNYWIFENGLPQEQQKKR